MTLHIHRPLLFLLIFFLLSPPCFGEEHSSVSDYEKGKQLFLASNFREARDLLFKAFRQDPANPDINFYLGRAAFELGDYETALMAYERVLIMNPDATRVKLEIARCHLRLGFKEMARQYFREVQATNPPQAVWENIQQYLEAIKEQDKRHLFTGTFTFGTSYDDNPGLLSVYDEFFGATLADPESDTVYTTTTVLNHIYRMESQGFSWKSTLINFNSLYDSQQIYDVNYYELSSGLVWRTDAFMWNNHALVKHIDVEHDRYLSSYGLGTIFTLPFSPEMLLTAGGNYEEKNNYPTPDRDASNFKFSLNPVLNIGPNRLSATFFKERENADADYYSYDRVGWKLQYDRILPISMSAFASIGYENTDYDAPEIFISRSDRVQELKTGVSKLLWQSAASHNSLSTQLIYTYLDAKSNVELYTYRKNLITLSFTLGFY